MVAVIKTSRSVRSVLSYNENKVKTAQAQCIGEGNYPMAVERMNFSMKLQRLLGQTALNENVKRAGVHISLNFHPSENYTREKLLEIADSYMEKIGFGSQPYLVYEHQDAGHPHIHLVSIKIRADGSRIDMQNIGKNQSEKARKEIEKAFGLVKAQGRNSKQVSLIKNPAAVKICYGKMESKKALSNVLGAVLYNYSYTSLAALNAVLQLYGVKADRGSEDSRIFTSGGLVYRILDPDGKPAGVPIKASDFSMRPTLAFLERRFEVNSTEKSFEKKRIRTAVDTALLGREMHFQKLILMLRAQGIDTVLRKSSTGSLYGITYVDHATKCVFNGSELGRNYSAKAMLERCEKTVEYRAVIIQKDVLEMGGQDKQQQYAGAGVSEVFASGIQELLKAEWQADYVSGKFKVRSRKKRRKGPLNRN